MSITGLAALTVTSTDVITLTTASNDFGQLQINAGTGAVTINDDNAVDIGASTLGESLSITADDIEIVGAVSVGTTANLNASGGGGNIITSGAGDLSVAGTTTLQAQATDSIDLEGDFDNDNSGDAVSVTGTISALTLDDSDAIELGAASVTNALIVTAQGIEVSGAVSAGSTTLDASGGDLTGTGSLSITGLAALTVTSTDVITLTTASNDFGELQLNAGTGAVNITDTDVVDVGASTLGGSLTLTADDIEIVGLLSVGTSANLDASGGVGDIITSGAGDLSVAGTTTLQAQATDSIDLDGDFDSDDSGDAVSVTGTISALTLDDSDAIELGAAAVTNALSVTAQGIEITGAVSAGSTTLDASGGDLTGTGSLSITGLAAVTVTSTDVITLTSTSNDFGQLQINTGSGDASINDSNDLAIGASLVGGTLTVTAGRIDVTGMVTAGSLLLDATGDISETGGMLIAGLADLQVDGTNIIDLSGAHDFDVLQVSAGSGAVTINDSDDLSIGPVSAGGALSVTATGIDLIALVSSDSVLLNASGGDLTSSSGTLSANGFADLQVTGTDVITLLGGNDVGELRVSAGTGAVSFNDVNTLDLGATMVSASLGITASAIDVVGSVTVDALTLDVSASAGNIESSTGSLNVVGATLLTTGSADQINLTGAHDFDSDDTGDAVTLNASVAEVTLNDVDNIVLGGAMVTSGLTVTAGGTIEQSAGITAQTGVFSTPADITLNDGANDFESIGIVNGNNVSVNDANVLTLLDANVAGSFGVIAESVLITGTAVANALDVNIAAGVGSVSDGTNGSFQVTTQSTFTGGANDIILDSDQHDFNDILASTTGQVVISDVDDVSLDDSVVTGGFMVFAPGIDVSGTLSVSDLVLDATGGSITSSTGGVTATGVSTFTVTGTDVIDLNGTHDFDEVRVMAGTGTVSLDDVTGIQLGGSTSTGLMSVEANGISTVDSVAAGQLLFDGQGGPIVIDHALTTSNGEIRFQDASLLSIGNDLNSGQAIHASNIPLVQLSPVVISAMDDIDLSDNVGEVSLSGGGLVDISSLDDGDVALSDISDAGDGLVTSLRVSSEGSITLAAVDMDDGSTDGSLTLLSDIDDDELSMLTISGVVNAASIVIGGSGDDAASLDQTIMTSLGDVSVSDFDAVDLSGADSAGAMLVERVATLRLDEGAYRARGGDLDLSAPLGVEITGSLVNLISDNVDVLSAPIIDGGDGVTTNLQINAGADVVLGAVNLDDGGSDGSLTISFGEAGAGVATAGLSSVVNILNLDATGDPGLDDLLTFNDDISASGAASFSDMSAVSLTAGVDLTAQSMDFDDVTTLNLSSGSNHVLTTIAEMTLAPVDSATGSLALNAGGAIQLPAFGGGGDLEIANSANTVVSGVVDAGTILLTNSASLITFADAVTASNLVTTASGYGLAFTGDSVVINSAVSLDNTGGIQLGDAPSDLFYVDGSVSASDTVTLSGELRTNNGVVTLQDLVLTSDAAVDSTNNGAGIGAAIAVQQLIGTGTQVLTLSAGSGTLSVDGNVDGLDTLSIASAADVDLIGAVGVLTPVTLTLDSIADGSIVLMSGGILLNDLTTLSAGDYAIQLTGTTNVVEGNAVLNQTGGLTLGDGGDTTLFESGLVYNAGVTSLAGTILSEGASLTLGDLALGAGLSEIDTTNGGANAAGAPITVGAVAGATATLSVDAGTGSHVVTIGGDLNLQDFVTAPSLFSVAFLGTSNSVTSHVNFSNTGELVFGDESSDSIQFTGGLSVNSPTRIAGTLRTVGTPIPLVSLIVVEGTEASLVSGGGLISVASPTTGTAGGGAEQVRINAGSGNVNLADVLGAADGLTELTLVSAGNADFANVNLPGALSQQAGTGTTRFLGSLVAGTVSVVAGAIEVTDDVTADGGITLQGNILLGGDLTTDGADVNLNGDIELPNDADLIMTTNGGSVTATGQIRGNSQVGTESLTVDAAAGEVILNDIAGALGGVSVGGLVDLTIASSSEVQIGDVALSGTLSVSTTGVLAQLLGTEIELGGSASLIADDITLGSFSTDVSLRVTADDVSIADLTTPDVVMSVTGDTTITSTQSQELTLAGSVGGSLSVVAAEGISGNSLNVTGASTFTGDSLALTNLSAAGALSFNIVDEVMVTNDQSTVISGSAQTLTVATSLGSISDDGPLSIGGAAVFDAEGVGGGITLDNAGNRFGTLTLRGSGGTVVLRESEDTELSEVLADTLTINSDGQIIDAASAQIQVTGNSLLSASGAVILGDDPADSVDFAVLDVNTPGFLVIGESSVDGVQLRDITASEIDLTTQGAIIGIAGGVVTISGSVVLNAADGAGDIDLSASSNAFLDLDVTGATVNISERDAMVFQQLTADELVVTAAGNISDVGVLTVSGAATFDAGTSDITLDAGNRFGQLSVSGGDVFVTEADAGVLDFVAVDTLEIVATELSQVAGSVINVSDNFMVNVGAGSVQLNGAFNNFGTMTLNGGDVSIRENSASRLDIVTTGTLSLTSSGDVTQSNDGMVTVAGLFSVDSGIANIALNSGDNTAGSISLRGADIQFTELDGTQLVEVVADELILLSGGAVTSSMALFVGGETRFESVSDSDISLTSTLNEFGPLTLVGGDVDVEVANDIILAGVDVSGSLTLTAGSNVTDVANANLDVLGLATLIAVTGDITLGDNPGDIVNFGTVDLAGAGVSLIEDSSLQVAGATADTLTLRSDDDILQSADAVITVTDLASLQANGDVVLDNGLNTFNRLEVEGADVQLTDATASVLTGIDAETFLLSTVGDVSDSGSVVVTGATEFVAGGDITLDSIGNLFGSLNLIGSDVLIQSSGTIILDDVTAESLRVQSDSSIVDTGLGAAINVSGLADFQASTVITIGQSGNSVRFGQLSLDGQSVNLTETDGTSLRDVVVSDLTLNSGDAVGQSETSLFTVANATSITARGGEGNVILDFAGNDLGVLSLSAGDAQVVSATPMSLDQVSVNALTIDAPEVSQVSTSSISVSDALTATVSGDITLNGDNNTVGVVSVDADDVIVHDMTTVTLDRVTASTLTLVAEDILQTLTSVVDVDGVLDAVASQAIDLSTGQNQFGSVTASGVAVMLTEQNQMDLQTIEASSATLTSTNGDIVTATSATITIADDLNVLATTGDVRLGDSAGSIVALGRLDAQAGLVRINETDGLILGVLEAGELSVTSAGSIVSDTLTNIGVVGDASFETSMDVLLQNGELSAGRVSLTADLARIEEDDPAGSVLGDITASVLEYSSAGSIDATGAIVVADLDLTAAGGLGDISVTNALNNLNIVSASGGSLALRSQGTIALRTVSTDALTIDVDDGGVSVLSGAQVIADQADIDVSEDVLLNLDLATVQFASLTGSATDLSLIQSGDLLLGPLAVSGVLEVGLSSGDLTSVDGASLSAGRVDVSVDALAGTVDFQSSQNTFGDISVVAHTARLSESGDTALADITVDHLIVNAANVSQVAGSNISVGSVLDLTATGQVSLGTGLDTMLTAGLVDLDALAFDGAFDGSTTLNEISAEDVTISVTGILDQSLDGTISVTDLASFSATGDESTISLAGSSNTLNRVQVMSDNTALRVLDDVTVESATGGVLNITAGGELTLGAQNASTDLTGATTLLADQITIGGFDNDSYRFSGLLASTRGEGSVAIQSSLQSIVETGSGVLNALDLASDTVVLGNGSSNVTITTNGNAAATAVRIGGLDGDGLPSTAVNVVVAGEVAIDTTNGGLASGDDLTIAAAGMISAADDGSNGLTIDTGVGNLTLGHVGGPAFLSSLVVTNAGDLNMGSLAVAGNTIDLTSMTGDISVAGDVLDTVGEIRVDALVGDVAFSGSVDAQGDISLSAGGQVSLLGSHVESVMGTVTIQGGGSENAEGVTGTSVITAGREILIGAQGSVNVTSLTAVSDVSLVSTEGDILLGGDVHSGGALTAVSAVGRLTQGVGTVATAAETVSLVAEQGMDISRVLGNSDVVLVVNQTEAGAGELPRFQRVNEQIPLGQGDEVQDVASTNGSIVWVAPIADVGSQEPDQNFVQRAENGGIFFGLERGQFFSDDIGTASLLSVVPTSSVNILSDVFSVDSDILNLAANIDPVTFGVSSQSLFLESISASLDSNATAGETSAAASSRSTAASQRDDEEEVAEVDEAAFQNLRNYDENPQGIRLPEDQNPEVLVESEKETPHEQDDAGQISAYRPTLNPLSGWTTSGL
ncbi:MAG: hypothetical protein AAF525_03200 [Pseudomonadota bacterium]